MMNNKTIKMNFLAIICMICILAGIFVPANTTLMAEESRPGISCGYNVTDGQLVIYLYGHNFEKICSYTQSITYDSELVRLAEYKVEDALKGSLVSVNEQQGKTTIAVADMAGVSINGYGMVTLKYDLLFEGTKEIIMEQNVLECTNNQLENVEVDYEKTSTFLAEHSSASYYECSIESAFEVDIDKESSACFRFLKNPGFYSGSFEITYNPEELNFQSVAAVNKEDGILVSYNEEEKGRVRVAFASEDGYTRTQSFLAINFIPIKESNWNYFNVQELKITSLELKEIAFSSTYMGYFYTTSVSGNNYFKINAPQQMSAMDTLEIKLELENNSGFSALTGTFNYDAEMFEFVSAGVDDGILSSALSNISGAQEGKVKIAAVSSGNITENGMLATIILKSKKNINKKTEFTLYMDELMDSGANPLAYTTEMQQVFVNKKCEHAYGAPEFIWEDDYSQCTAVYTCIHDGEHQKQDVCSIQCLVTDAGCETEGLKTYTATSNCTGETYTSQKTMVLPAKGHDWEDKYTIDVQPTYESEGSQSIHCKNCTETKDVQTIPMLVKDDNGNGINGGNNSGTDVENGTDNGGNVTDNGGNVTGNGGNGTSGGNTSGIQNAGVTQTPDNSKVTAAGSTKSKTKKPVIKFLNSKKKSITKVSLKRKKSLKVTIKVTPASSKLKLAKLSKKQKKIAAVSLKKNRLTIKGKKKGTITIKVTSGKTAKKLKIVVK